MRFLSLSSMALFVSTCSTTPMSNPDGGGTLDGCNCAAPSAAQVSYDKAMSGLSGTNVQSALDELARRPIAEAPIGPRIVRVQHQTQNPGGTSFTANANCPDPAHDIPLSGDCDAGFDAQIRMTSIIFVDANASGGPAAGFLCGFTQQPTNTNPGVVSVLCLRNAR